MNTCPDCKCEFVQPFRCATCGAQKLYDHTVTSQQQTIDALRARVAEAETYRTFWQRYAMPPKARPSCLVCGRVSEDWPPAIKHMALPSVIVCTPCVTAVRTASNKTAP